MDTNINSFSNFDLFISFIFVPVLSPADLFFLPHFENVTQYLWSLPTLSFAVNGPHDGSKRLSSMMFGLSACFSRSWRPVCTLLLFVLANNFLNYCSCRFDQQRDACEVLCFQQSVDCTWYSAWFGNLFQNVVGI